MTTDPKRRAAITHRARTPHNSVRRRNAVVAATLLIALAVSACGTDSNARKASSPPSADNAGEQTDTSTTVTSTFSSTTLGTTTSETSPTDPAALPGEPRVLYEWYPAHESDKAIIVSDETLSFPPKRIVPTSDGAAIHSNWSHDGTMIAWEVLRGNDTSSVWTANADGSEPTERAVCTAAPCVEMSYPSFSHDDSQLLVTQFDRADNGDWGPSHLVLVDISTGEQTVIASTADGSTAFYSATMSPDGSQVAAALETYTDATESVRTQAEIVLADTDPATVDVPVRLTDPTLFAGYPRWHPTDDRILFASWDLDAFQGAEESQLYTIKGDGSGLTQITDVDYTTTRRRPGEAIWTPDGQRIIASIGVVDANRVVDVKIAYIDPTTGTITETSASGAMPSLQP